MYFSFAKGFLKIEPPKSTWDVVFTQYTHVFNDPMQTYLVLGVLISPDVEAAKVDSIPFENIGFDFANSQTFSFQRDLIGYNWKEYSFETQSYKVYSDKMDVVEEIIEKKPIDTNLLLL